MRYSSYKLKYASKVKKLNLLYKLRFVFIGVGATTVVTTGTLLGVKGHVGETTSSQNTYTYGETVQIDSSALMNDYFIEYASKDSDNWSTEAPTKPGQYKARGVSKGGFGKNKYGKETYFEIKPADLNVPISSTKLTYGEEPLLNLAEPQNKRLTLQNINFEYGAKFDEIDPFGTNPTYKEDVSLKTKEVKVFNSNGQDVTECYNIVSETKNLEVSKKDIVIDIGSAAKVYDGNALENRQYSLNSQYSLATGDELALQSSASITEIGSVSNEMVFKVVNGDKDKTAFYNIRTNNGTLTINKRKLIISTNSISREYNGYPLAVDAERQENKLIYILSGDGLLTGHSLDNIEFALAGKFVTNQSLTNTISTNDLYIKDGEGNSVKDLYEVSLEPGTVNISKRNITVKFEGKSKTYDGSALTSDYNDTNLPIVEGSLADTDKGRITNKNEIQEIGVSLITDEFSIVNEELGNEDVTDLYYNVHYQSRGYLEVTKVNLTITTNSIIRTKYNGHALSKDAPEDENKLEYSTNGLIPGHRIVPLDPAKPLFDLEGKKIVTGAYNSIQYDIVDADDNSVRNLYNVSTNYGYVRIEKLKITYVFNLSDMVYTGGGSYRVNLPEPEAGSDELVNGDYAVVTGNEIADLTVGRHNASTGFYPNVTIYNLNGDDVSSSGTNCCYDLTVRRNKNYIDVVRQTITISTDSINSTYNGERLSVNATDPERKLKAPTVTGNLVNGHTLHVTNYDLEGQFYGNFTNSVQYEILDANGNPINIAEYYTVIENFGTVNIGKKDATYTINSVTKIYDGTGITPAITGVTGLVEGDQFTPIGFGKDASIGTYSNTYYAQITGPLGDVTHCYRLSSSSKYVSLQITKRNLEITSSNVTKTYDGFAITRGNATSDIQDPVISPDCDGLLSPDHTITYSFANEGNLINVCTNVQNTFTVTIRDRDYNDVTDHYNIVRTYGKINILKRDLEINKDPLSLTYNGEEQGYPVGGISYSGLAETDQITFNKFEKVGTYYDESLFDITNKVSGTNVRSNYNIISNLNDNLTILPLTVYYSVYDTDLGAGGTITKTYDANPIDRYALFQDIWCDNNSGTLPLGYYTSISFESQDVTRVTASPQKFKYSMRVYKSTASGDIDVTNNGNFTVVKEDTKTASFQINKRHLGISVDADFTYNYYTQYASISDTVFTNLAGSDYAQSCSFNGISKVSQSPMDIQMTNLVIYNPSLGNVTNCYDYVQNQVVGTYTMGKRSASFSFSTYEKTYDGIPLTSDNFSCYPSGLADYDYITYDIDPNYKEYTEYLTNHTNDSYYSLPMVVHIWSGSVDVSDCYDLTIYDATFRIYKRTLNLEFHLNDSNVEYSGYEHYLSDFAGMGVSGIAPYQNIYDLFSPIKDAGEYVVFDIRNETFADWYDIRDQQGNSQLDNYIINFTYGAGSYVLSVVKRDIYINATGYSKVFDGNTYNAANSYNYTRLVYGHTLTTSVQIYDSNNNLVNTQQIYDADIYNITIGDATIVDSNNVDVTSNYEIHRGEPAVLAVYQRKIVYQVIDSDMTYGQNTEVSKDITFTRNSQSSTYLKIVGYEIVGADINANNVDQYGNTVYDDQVAFYSNFNIQGHFTPNDGSSGITETATKYEFYRANGIPYLFESEMTASKKTGASETYSSDAQSGDENILFGLSGSSSDNTLQINTNTRDLIISNTNNSPIVFYPREIETVEQLTVRGLLSTDHLYVGEEEYSASKKEYAAINLNGLYPRQSTPYQIGPENANYFDKVLNAGAVGDLLTIKREVKLANGTKTYVDVTDCYNFTFAFTDYISFRVI